MSATNSEYCNNLKIESARGPGVEMIEPDRCLNIHRAAQQTRRQSAQNQIPNPVRVAATESGRRKRRGGRKKRRRSTRRTKRNPRKATRKTNRQDHISPVGSEGGGPAGRRSGSSNQSHSRPRKNPCMQTVNQRASVIRCHCLCTCFGQGFGQAPDTSSLPWHPFFVGYLRCNANKISIHLHRYRTNLKRHYDAPSIPADQLLF
mmetsp:Transcript_49755/g.130861  ORF Transcript_49755/g.130861 Transcript_49755/m.130861 type:complete len:204 (+) Transcript_49755:183-794(+)